MADTKKRDYKKEYDTYQGTPEQIHKRSLRNQARRELIKEGIAHVGDGKDVDHKRPLALNGTNAQANLREIEASRNRGWRKGQKGYKVKSV